MSDFTDAVKASAHKSALYRDRALKAERRNRDAEPLSKRARRHAASAMADLKQATGGNTQGLTNWLPCLAEDICDLTDERGLTLTDDSWDGLLQQALDGYAKEDGVPADVAELVTQLQERLVELAG